MKIKKASKGLIGFEPSTWELASLYKCKDMGERAKDWQELNPQSLSVPANAPFVVPLPCPPWQPLCKSQCSNVSCSWVNIKLFVVRLCLGPFKSFFVRTFFLARYSFIFLEAVLFFITLAKLLDLHHHNINNDIGDVVDDGGDNVDDNHKSRRQKLFQCKRVFFVDDCRAFLLLRVWTWDG